MHYYNKDDANTGRALGGAMDELRWTGTEAVYGSDLKPQGLLHLMPSPSAGSASKRACLFLRWMVRDRDIDLGLWKGIPADRLVIPLDTHISRVSRCLGLTRRRDAGWKTAVEITESLKNLDPLDPLKYDFALCHHGISGVCPRPGSDEGCSGCALKGVRT